MAEPSLRVLIVEDHAIFASALALLLERTPGIQLVGIASDGAEGIDLAMLSDAEVILMDLGLPKINGIEATRKLLALNPRARVIAVTGHAGAEEKAAAFDAGAVDFLTKGGIHDHVRDAIFRAMSPRSDQPPPAGFHPDSA